MGLSSHWGRLSRSNPLFLMSVVWRALTVMFAYIIIRLLFTSHGANPLSFALLFMAELMSLIASALHFYDAWSVPDLEAHEPLDCTTDIIITTYNEPLTVLEPTVIGSLRVHGVRNVWVLDDGRREEVREFAEKVGARYVTRSDNAHAKAGNINNALGLIDSDLILSLDADHVPSRRIIKELSGYFRDPSVALVQSPHNFRNLDSAQHKSRSRHEQSLFFHVLQPSRDRNDASFWCGSSALLRTSALKAIGGVATETVSEDLHTTLRLQQHGYKARYHNQVLATGLAPHTIADFLLQRYRWAQGTMQVLLSPESPLFGRGWKVRQRLHYGNNLIYYLLPFQRLTYALVLLLVLLFAWIPIGDVSPVFYVLLAASVVFSNLAAVGLARGTRDSFEGVAYTWITAETYMRAVIFTLLGRNEPFRVTPKSLNALGLREKLVRLRLPLIVLSVILIAWMMRAWQEWAGTLPFGLKLPGQLDSVAFWVATGFTVLEILSVLPSIIRELQRTQKRSLWRFTVELNAELNGHAVTVKDIHESGLSLIGPSGLCSVGQDVDLVIEPPPNTDLDAVTGFLRVHRLIELGERSIYGGSLTWAHESDRHRVIDLCYSYLSHDQKSVAERSGR